jgi:DNA-binding MarR family transcriptional regulator/AcrR family transcriptional regulator
VITPPEPPAAHGARTAQAAPPRRRTHDPRANRRAVLLAARRLFAAHGYDGTTMRAVAAEAGVTAPLVISYFGSKDGLFREVVAGGGPGITGEVLAAAGQGPRQAARALAHGYLERWDRLPSDDPWSALIRSAATHPPAAAMLQDLLDEHVGEPLAELLGEAPDADVTTALVRSILFGVIVERYLFAHEPARSVPTAELEPALAEVLTTALAGPGGATAPGLAAGTSGAAEPPPVEGPVAAAGAAAGARPGAGTAADAGPGAADLFDRLQRCSARYQARIGRLLEQHGITLAAFDVLSALRRSGEPYRRTLGELAAAAPVSTSGITLRADRLEAAGLVVRERDEEDRRIVHLRLTASGSDLVDVVAQDRSAAERRMLAVLRPDERSRLARLLDTLGHSLDATDRHTHG